MYVLNALLASGQLDGQGGENLSCKIESMKIDELKNSYLTHMKKAAEATFEPDKRIDENKTKVRHLESIRNRVWGFCFAFQSLGMLFGLGAVFMRR